MAILEEFHNNGMWVASPETENGITISRQKLTDEQFNSAVDYLKNKLNEYGRGK